jgi:uncharacterized protein (DUF58 family)
VILSDFLVGSDQLRDRLRSLAGRGANLHLLQIFDPAEETFPYEGRLEFRDPESGDTWLTSAPAACDRSTARGLKHIAT